jgi:hypothetical protein
VIEFKGYFKLYEQSRTEISRQLMAAAQRWSEVNNAELPIGKALTSKGGVRLQPTEPGKKIDIDIVKKLFRSIGHEFVREIAPRGEGAKSSKYITYVTDKGLSVVIGSGGNVGISYEVEISNALMRVLEDSTDIPPRITNLLNGLGIEPSELVNVDYTVGFAAKRPPGKEPKNVGPIISDLTLYTKDQVFYISLKNISGKTFANYGIHNAFLQSADGDITYNSSTSRADLIKALGLNTDEICKGLTAYRDKEFKEPVIDTNPAYDKEVLTGYMLNSYGYGYWYARERRNDEWEIIDLTTEEKLLNHFGSAVITKIVYPKLTSKQTNIYIATTKGKEYVAEVRNTSGGLLPTEIKIGVKK